MRKPHDQTFLLEAMKSGCLGMSAEDYQRWIRHAERFSFSRVDFSGGLQEMRCYEDLWPNAQKWSTSTVVFQCL